MSHTILPAVCKDESAAQYDSAADRDFSRCVSGECVMFRFPINSAPSCIVTAFHINQFRQHPARAVMDKIISIRLWSSAVKHYMRINWDSLIAQMPRFGLLLPGLLALLPYCSAQNADFSIPSTFTDWDNNDWVLSSTKLIQGQYQARSPMGNG